MPSFVLHKEDVALGMVALLFVMLKQEGLFAAMGHIHQPAAVISNYF